MGDTKDNEDVTMVVVVNELDIGKEFRLGEHTARINRSALKRGPRKKEAGMSTVIADCRSREQSVALFARKGVRIVTKICHSLMRDHFVSRTNEPYKTPFERSQFAYTSVSF